jgi:hypothetical protein
MPASVHATWHPLNLVGAARYRLQRLRGRHQWQREPAVDLPDEVPADAATSEPAATSAG